MNQIRITIRQALLIASSSLALSACNFDSDSDYKSEERDGAVDTAQRGTREYRQHEPTVPPLDAVPQNDSFQQNSPRTNDSSIKKDSSRSNQPGAGGRTGDPQLGGGRTNPGDGSAIGSGTGGGGATGTGSGGDKSSLRGGGAATDAQSGGDATQKGANGS